MAGENGWWNAPRRQPRSPVIKENPLGVRPPRRLMSRIQSHPEFTDLLTRDAPSGLTNLSRMTAAEAQAANLAAAQPVTTRELNTRYRDLFEDDKMNVSLNVLDNEGRIHHISDVPRVPVQKRAPWEVGQQLGFEGEQLDKFVEESINRRGGYTPWRYERVPQRYRHLVNEPDPFPTPRPDRLRVEEKAAFKLESLQATTPHIPEGHGPGAPIPPPTGNGGGAPPPKPPPKAGDPVPHGDVPKMSQLEKRLFGEKRLKFTNSALKIGLGVIAAAGVIDLGIRTNRFFEMRKQMDKQEADLRMKQARDRQDRQAFLNSAAYTSIVQNQFTNRIGHYKQGNAKNKI